MVDRSHLGQIEPERRRHFDITGLTRKLIPQLDHLCVVHRVPTRLLQGQSRVEDEIEMGVEPDYSFFRSLVEFSYPQGGNGSVIYETPPRLNAGSGTNTLSFTCQVVLSEQINTHVILINYSTDPSYSRIARYAFGVYSLAGELVANGDVDVGPFGIQLLDMATLIPQELATGEMEARDGLAAFTFVGYSNDAAFLMMTINAAPSLGAVSVEHTHPPQAYMFPFDPGQRNAVKADAQDAWKAILSKGVAG